MEYNVDTLIIGGGPAGISCALRLSRANVSNIVVEKRSFPREKLCGGLVTDKTLRKLSENLGLSREELSDFFCDASDKIRLYRGRELLTDSKLSPGFHLIKRKDFDNRLVGIYKNLGGVLLENTVCEDIDLTEKRAVLSNGDSVRFRHLVVADGAQSRTRSVLGYKKPKLGFCVETQVPREKLVRGGEIELFFGIVKNGYAWIFPSGDTYCIGLIGRGAQKFDLLLKDFLASLGLNPDECGIKGAFIPYGYPVKQSGGSDDALLVGDAAGFADPITGEGLYFAMQSGTCAADVIIGGGEKIRPEYLKRTADIFKTIRQGRILQKIFYRPAMQKAFAKVMRGKNGFVGFFCDNLVSSYKYPYLRIRKLCRDYKKSK